MSRYMTQEGFTAIQTEIDFLWTEERPRIVEQVHAAAELGDRSENAAYIYGKKRLREIDGRLRYLRRKTEGVTVIDLREQIAHSNIRFGALVTVLDDDDEEITWRLVDRDESDVKRGRISVQSPVGAALLGKEVGDYVTVKLPKGEVGFEVLSIRYGVPNE